MTTGAIANSLYSHKNFCLENFTALLNLWLMTLSIIICSCTYRSSLSSNVHHQLRTSITLNCYIITRTTIKHRAGTVQKTHEVLELSCTCRMSLRSSFSIIPPRSQAIFPCCSYSYSILCALGSLHGDSVLFVLESFRRSMHVHTRSEVLSCTSSVTSLMLLIVNYTYYEHGYVQTEELLVHYVTSLIT